MSAGEQALRDQFEGFTPRTLTWLGALPTWTPELARRLELSTGGESVTDLMKRLTAEDIIETRQIRGADGRPTESFWLRPSLRQELGRYLRQQPKSAARLAQDLNRLAAAVQALDVTSATAGSIGSAQWLRIVRDYRGDPTGLMLMSDVDELVADGRLGDASTLVAAARGLGELASRTLFEAARRAQWRVDRAVRIEHDVQRLRHYCRRPAIEAAIRELAESADSAGPGEPWALHLLGDGGVGKTMLIRYLSTGSFAAAQRMRRPFLVARADFDHLDPSYPEQRPAELLLALAADLVGVTRTRELYQLLRLFQDAAAALHEERTGRRSGADQQDSLRQTVRYFADFVNGLGQPVLLVLDTCEELEKLYLPRAPAPAIDETFRLLELVREAAPQVRVLFAGRRWLVPTAERSGASGPLLRPRPYLRVVPVGGFTEAEAQAYIDDRENGRGEDSTGSAPPHLGPRPGLRQALLDRSRSVTLPDGSAEYSPFELASYCDWAASDPDLDAGKLRSAPGDPYVEWRIIGRLGDDRVRAALGVAAEFGRFDLALVTPALTRAGIDARAAFDGLAAQEWVNVLSVGEDGGPAVIEIDQHLLDRIRKVTARGSEWLKPDRRRLGEDARRVIEGGLLTALPAETVDAAIRLLPAEPAAALWQRIEDRCCEERAWGWAARVTERVAAMEARRAEDSDGPTILAAIFATQASATLHTAPGSDPSELWRKVEAEAPRHPGREAQTVLRCRARLGRLATGDLSQTAEIVRAYREGTPISHRRTVLLGAIVAAVHGCVTRGQDLDGEGVTEMLRAVASAAGPSPASAAVTLASAVRELWASSLFGAASTADRAIGAASATPPGPARDWADWVPPRRLADQCRLVRVIIACRGGWLSDVEWRRWRDDALRHLDDPDAERLAAATIRFELGDHPISTTELERVALLDRYVPARGPLPWTHRQIGPLVVELAEAWRVNGDPYRGFVLLNERCDAAVRAGDDPDTIEACLLAMLRLCRRERSTDYAPARQLSREGSPALKGEAWLVRTLTDGEQPRSPEEAGGWFAWWRCQDTDSLTSLRDDPPGTGYIGPPSPPPPELTGPAERADAAEFGAFFPEMAGDARDRSWRPSPVFDLEGEYRLAAASVPPAGPGPAPETGGPPGARGRAAMAAAEVMALRSPARAVELLRNARRYLLDGGDERGALQAALLAGLTMARMQDRRGAGAAWSPDGAPRDVGEGWQRRADALEAYLSHRRPPAGLPASPEVRLPAPATGIVRRVSGNLRGLGWISLGVAITTAGILSILATSFHALDWVQLVSLPLAALGAISALIDIARTRADRFARARAIKVSQPGDGQVAAEIVPSRGVADLRGLRLVTIGGALLGRWPLWTMVRPWRGDWAQSLPSDPAPVFDLGGLRLPKRGGWRRLALLEIRTDTAADMALPWEQWLGAAVPKDLARAHLWYRRIGGHAWVPRARQWRRGRSERYGSSLGKQSGRVTPGTKPHSFRLLHIVGTPVPTNAGWRLRAPVYSGGLDSHASGDTQARDGLLRVDSFPLRRMGLAVLQADPVDGLPQTLGGLRAGFMGCAQDMMDGGANAVLVVPPLPDGVANEVQEYLWKRVHRRRRPPSPTDVLRIQAHVKRLVAAASPAGSAGHRPVLDVLLFLRAATGGTSAPTTERST